MLSCFLHIFVISYVELFAPYKNYESASCFLHTFVISNVELFAPGNELLITVVLPSSIMGEKWIHLVVCTLKYYPIFILEIHNRCICKSCLLNR